MISQEYRIAYSEILEILKYIPKEDYDKIPKEKIKAFETFADHQYKFNYNVNKTLEENNVSKIAQGIIAILFRDYWATELQRDKILKFQNYSRDELEKQKLEKYDANDMYRKKNNSTIIEKEKDNNEITDMIEIKENFFQKIIKKIKMFFK